MGVPGLMSHILANKDICVEYVDLVERARLANQRADSTANQIGIDLLIDFHCFANYLLSKFTASLSMANPYVGIQGGEYALMDNWLRRLLSDLASVGLNLIWHIDAARGCCERTDYQKTAIWKQRQEQDVQKRAVLLKWCSGYTSDAAGVEPLRPVCLEQQMIATIRASGCQVFQAVRGEADYSLAQALLTNRRALAVLSNDTDLCVFRDSVLLPMQLFDIYNDLRLGDQPALGQAPMPQRPIRLVVGLVSGPSVLKLFGFNSWDLLVDLSILMGNDFTGSLLGNRARLIRDLRIRHAAVKSECVDGDTKSRLTIADFAAWLRSIDGLANSPEFQHRLRNEPRLREAVEHTRQFYCLMLIEGVEPTTAAAARCPLDAHLESGVKEGRYSPALVAMRRGFYWRRVCLEDDTPGHPSAEDGAAAELRNLAHRCVLGDNDRDDRQEFDARDGGHWIRMRASPRRIQGVQIDLSPLNSRPLSVVEASAAFCCLLGCPDASRSYGWRSGAMCSALRYFLTSNCNQLLAINIDEALAIVLPALALHLVRPAWYASLPIRPSVRCVTVASAWLTTFRSAIAVLAPALGLPVGDLPTPAEAFSGGVFVAFFMLKAHDGVGLRHLDRRDLDRIGGDWRRLIREKRHVLTRLVNGLYQIDF